MAQPGSEPEGKKTQKGEAVSDVFSPASIEVLKHKTWDVWLTYEALLPLALSSIAIACPDQDAAFDFSESEMKELSVLLDGLEAQVFDLLQSTQRRTAKLRRARMEMQTAHAIVADSNAGWMPTR